MIKYIGVMLMLTGAVLLALVIIAGRRNNIREVYNELEMIKGSGYVTAHKEIRQEKSVLETTPVKVPPRKRVLSREAADILKMVEEERQAEREAGEEGRRRPARNVRRSPRLKKTDADKGGDGREKRGTDVLENNMPLEKEDRPLKEAASAAVEGQSSGGTAILLTAADGKRAGETSSTDILPATRKSRQATDALEPGPETGGHETAVLPEEASKEVHTDVLTEKTAGKGETAILPQRSRRRSGTEVLRTGKKDTDVLQEKKDGTAVLEQEDSRKKDKAGKRRGTEILEQKGAQNNQGTAVLTDDANRRKKGTGTAVLGQETVRKGTDILIQKED